MSLLATAEDSDLDYLQADIWPHRLVCDIRTPKSTNDWSARSLYADSAIYLQPGSSNSGQFGSYKHPECASQDRDLPDELAYRPTAEDLYASSESNVLLTGSYIAGVRQEQERLGNSTNPASSTYALVVEPSKKNPVSVSAHPYLPPWFDESPPSSLIPSEPTPTRNESSLPWPDEVPQSLYAQCIYHLDRLYGGITNHIPGIIRIGDSIFRDDAAAFVRLFCHEWSSTGLWYRRNIVPLIGACSKLDEAVHDFRRAEDLTHSSELERFRLRVARVLLYHSFERLCVDIQNELGTAETLLRGKGAASVAIDRLLFGFEESEGTKSSCQTSKQRRDKLQKHKSIGKKWSILATTFGLGIFLTCSLDFETQM